MHSTDVAQTTFIEAAAKALDIPAGKRAIFATMLKDHWPSDIRRPTHRQSDLRPVLRRYEEAIKTVERLMLFNTQGEGRSRTARAHDEHGAALVRTCFFANTPTAWSLPSGESIDRQSIFDATTFGLERLRAAVGIARAKMRSDGTTGLPSRGRSRRKSFGVELLELTVFIAGLSQGSTADRAVREFVASERGRLVFADLADDTVTAAIKAARRRIKRISDP